MRLIVTGGGTGGHIYPAIAIANKFREKDPDGEILYLGNKNGIEDKVVPRHGYDIKLITARWLERNPVGMAKMSSDIMKGVRESRKIIREFKPDFIVGTGGFVCFPVMLAGYREKIPCFIHEQNVIPGAANKMLEKFSKNIFLGFPEATSHFRQPHKHIYTGNPVRSDFFNPDKGKAREKLGIPLDSFHILSMGGSWGSSYINGATLELAEWIADKEHYSLNFIAGEINYEEVLEDFEKQVEIPKDRVKLLAYANDMPDQMAAADLVISRAGALTVAEINCSGRPSILIPFPGATGNHQYYNAKSIADHGGAVLLEEGKSKPSDIINLVESLHDDPEKLATIGRESLKCGKTDATEIIWNHMTRKP